MRIAFAMKKSTFDNTTLEKHNLELEQTILSVLIESKNASKKIL